MQRLLIADSSELFAEALTNSLQADFDIRACFDGDEALTLLNTFRPDAMIIHLSLPFRDGLSVMQDAVFLPPVILALTNILNPHIDTACLALGVHALMISPTLNTVISGLFRALCSHVPGADNPRTQTQIRLRALGFSSQLEGYRLLCTGLPLYLRNRTQKLSMELYPAIAAICGISTEAVEHSIRNAIENAWSVRDPLVWEKYFPGARKAPANHAFLARLAEITADETP